jgi:hypothetical protein
MKKQLISWLSIIAIVVTLAPLSVLADDSAEAVTTTSSEVDDSDNSSDDSNDDSNDDSDDDSNDDSNDDSDDDSNDDSNDDSDDDDHNKRGNIKPYLENLNHRTVTLRVVWGDINENIDGGSTTESQVCNGMISSDSRVLVRDVLRFERNDELQNKYGTKIEFKSSIAGGIDGLIIQALAKEGDSLSFQSDCLGTFQFSFDDLKKDGQTETVGDLGVEVKLLKENSSLRKLLAPKSKERTEKLLDAKFERFKEQHGEFEGICKDIKETLEEFNFGSAKTEEGEINDDFERAIETTNPRLLEAKCKALKNKFEGLSQRITKVKFENGEISFEDTDNDWFTDFVEFASAQGIIEGFKDEQGRSTGKFGPADFVRITELAKIANKVSGHDEESDDSELSEEEKNSWAHGHFARWKKLGITVPTENPGRYATRGEVFQAIYEAMIGTDNFAQTDCDISALNYSDLDVNHKYAKAACFLTAEGIVSGTSNGEIQLDAQVRRAEIAKIVHNAIKLLGSDDDLYDEYEADLPDEE